MNFKYFYRGLFALALLTALSSCKTPKDIAYFQDTEVNEIITTAKKQPITLKPGDKLSIIVKTSDPQISQLFNLGVYSTAVSNFETPLSGSGAVTSKDAIGGVSSGMSSYTVSDKGTIDFPLLGEIKVAGMSRSEIAGFIKGEIMGRDLAKDPTVTVEFLNTGIDILGEVRTPGRFDMNKDKLTILEAISLAGDLTISGRRDNIRVLREENGQMKIYTVDLTNAEKTMSSPVYYLAQNDIIYVEPSDVRKRQSTVNGNNVLSTGFWISIASLATSIVTTLGVFLKK